MEAQLQKQNTEGMEVKKPNLTGIPTQMKLDFERRSCLSFDDVRIHYNSEKPAQVRALAYTQGTQVYIKPGQERYLPHELGHVAQQKLGLVRPTSTRFPNMNDSPELERNPEQLRFLSPRRSVFQTASARQGVVQRQPDEKDWPYDESSAGYASVHDGKVGSIYFGPGRLRLIHPHGPEISPIHNNGGDKRALRYLIVPDSSRSVQNAQNKLKEFHKKKGWREIGQSGPVTIEGCIVYTLMEQNSIQNIPVEHRQNGKLFELFFSEQPAADGHPAGLKLTGRHPSRGGIDELPAKLTDPNQNSKENISLLTYAVALAQKITKGMTDYFAEYVENPDDTRAQTRQFIASIRLAEVDKISHSPTLNIRHRIVLENIVNYFHNLMTPDIFAAAYQEATKIHTEEQARRFGGFFGNQALRASGQIEKLGLEVDENN